MRTTLDLPDPLFREVKTRAVQQGMKLKDLLARYIEAGLRDPQMAPISLSTNPYPCPVAWQADGSVTSARSNADLFALLEEDYTAEYHGVSNPVEPQS